MDAVKCSKGQFYSSAHPTYSLGFTQIRICSSFSHSKYEHYKHRERSKAHLSRTSAFLQRAVSPSPPSLPSHPSSFLISYHPVLLQQRRSYVKPYHTLYSYFIHQTLQRIIMGLTTSTLISNPHSYASPAGEEPKEYDYIIIGGGTAGQYCILTSIPIQRL